MTTFIIYLTLTTASSIALVSLLLIMAIEKIKSLGYKIEVKTETI